MSSTTAQEDITVDVDEEKLLQELTVPELKERLRSNGQKVCSCDVCNMHFRCIVVVIKHIYTFDLISSFILCIAGYREEVRISSKIIISDTATAAATTNEQ